MCISRAHFVEHLARVLQPTALEVGQEELVGEEGGGPLPAGGLQVEMRPPGVPEGAGGGAPPEEDGERPGVEADAFVGEGGEVFERRRQGAMGAVVVEGSDEAGGGGRPVASGGSSRRGCGPAIHRRPTPVV